jgi:hypothetical protein
MITTRAIKTLNYLFKSKYHDFIVRKNTLLIVLYIVMIKRAFFRRRRTISFWNTHKISNTFTFTAKSIGHRVLDVRAQKLIHEFLKKHLKLMKQISTFRTKIIKIIPMVIKLQTTFRLMREMRAIVKIKKEE